MVALGGGAVSYERGTPVTGDNREAVRGDRARERDVRQSVSWGLGVVHSLSVEHLLLALWEAVQPPCHHLFALGFDNWEAVQPQTLNPTANR